MDSETEKAAKAHDGCRAMDRYVYGYELVIMSKTQLLITTAIRNTTN
jgi:hypothetical protein